MTILVLGATGTVGALVLQQLAGAGAPVLAATRAAHPAADERRFDFAKAKTWPGAFAGVDAMFVVRPPALSNVKRDMLPALEAAKRAGVRHMVFLSLQGAERNRVVPHAAVEAWLRGSGVRFTFIRPSFFTQNLSTTHAVDIRERDEIVVPAGSGRTAFVDVADVAAVAARALLDPAAHVGRAWTPTGAEALTYTDVAALLTAELGRPIRYTRPGALRYARHARRVLRMPWAMVLVTTAIYTTARLGLAASLTGDVLTVTGRPPRTMAETLHRERAVWVR